MKKLLLYALVLFIIASCGETPSSDLYLEITSTTPTKLQKNVSPATTITINFNENIKDVNIAIKNIDKSVEKIEGTFKISNKQFIFIPEYGLDTDTYKVTIYKKGTISANSKVLEENYVYTFTVFPQRVN